MHIVEEFEEEEVYAASMEERDEYREEDYNDLMQAFVVEALTPDTPRKKDDKWYLDTGATNHLTPRLDLEVME